MQVKKTLKYRCFWSFYFRVYLHHFTHLRLKKDEHSRKLQECTRNPIAARSRIAVLKLPYSPQTPPQIDILGLSEFKRKFYVIFWKRTNSLFSAIGVRSTNNLHTSTWLRIACSGTRNWNFREKIGKKFQLNLNQEALNSFENGITDMETMMRREPNWIEQRREIKV